MASEAGIRQAGLALLLLAWGTRAGPAVAAPGDTLESPAMVRIREIRRPVGTRDAGFDGFLAEGRLYVPAIVLPHLFDTTIQWKAAENRLILRRDGQHLDFTLGKNLGVEFADQKVDLGAPLHHYQGMLYLPIATVAEFFAEVAAFDKGEAALSLGPRPVRTAGVVPPPESRTRWENTLAELGGLDYAVALEKGAAVGQVFQKIWGTSEEAQRISGPGVRGDFYLRDTDLAGALPAKTALGKFVTVRYPKTGKQVTVMIVDVGPWNIDDPYWQKDGGRPDVEANGYSRMAKYAGKRTNLAGIDLSYETWFRLGVPRPRAFSGQHSDYVDWWFVE